MRTKKEREDKRRNSRVGNASVTEEDVKAIRRLGLVQSARDIAEVYCLGIETVRKILRRDSWKWVADDIDFEMPVGELTAAERQAADASLARVLARVEAAATPVPSGLATLAKFVDIEKAKHTRVDAALDELAAAPRSIPANPLDE